MKFNKISTWLWIGVGVLTVDFYFAKQDNTTPGYGIKPSPILHISYPFT
jgi:hypothetical protein